MYYFILFLCVQLKSGFTSVLNSSVRINACLQNMQNVFPITIDCFTDSTYKGLEYQCPAEIFERKHYLHDINKFSDKVREEARAESLPHQSVTENIDRHWTYIEGTGSQLGPLLASCALPQEAEKALMLCTHCSATAETLVCFQTYELLWRKWNLAQPRTPAEWTT